MAEQGRPADRGLRLHRSLLNRERRHSTLGNDLRRLREQHTEPEQFDRRRFAAPFLGSDQLDCQLTSDPGRLIEPCPPKRGDPPAAGRERPRRSASSAKRDRSSVFEERLRARNACPMQHDRSAPPHQRRSRPVTSCTSTGAPCADRRHRALPPTAPPRCPSLPPARGTSAR